MTFSRRTWLIAVTMAAALAVASGMRVLAEYGWQGLLAVFITTTFLSLLVLACLNDNGEERVP
ncbi:MAG: hypothetical protein IT340_20175 [Chloroflexi bacterium]|nr:hypothetical protein [Chloroflexota bacterium]